MEMYNIVEQLDRGSFGTIHMCLKRHNRQKMVMKRIYADLKGEELKSAQNEVAILKSLNHPNIIQYYDSYVQNGTFHIIMEYASHGSLQQLIEKNRPKYFNPQVVMNFFCQILMGLHHVHEKNIIHRDLKCENIFVTGLQCDVIKIGDFGISKLLSNSKMDTTVIGTYNYLAPELCRGKSYNRKTDIWALGCVLYEICAMEKMYHGTVSDIIVSIVNGKRKTIDSKRYGKQMQELLHLLLQSDPEKRPDTKTLMALADVFPSLHSLTVNLGCIFDKQ
ncbi:serine/threonine-protein kinase Nek8-like [Cylas formicarius]|uniref:serine/threonine-protein kinase Nek8-like n=1 Tax=Cylas formicarius TaxID=197179 RepID=UPI00295899F3|nr:serine/threonine-protein kinase Nek8-like [Cylas formicarius]